MHISPFMILSGALVGTIAAFLAHRREKNPYFWFLVGFLFGLIGLFFIFFVPGKKKAEVKAAPVLTIQGPTDKFWYYVDEKRETQGPISLDALRRAWKEGKVCGSTYVWYEGMSSWTPLKETLQPE